MGDQSWAQGARKVPAEGGVSAQPHGAGLGESEQGKGAQWETASRRGTLPLRKWDSQGRGSQWGGGTTPFPTPPSQPQPRASSFLRSLAAAGPGPRPLSFPICSSAWGGGEAIGGCAAALKRRGLQELAPHAPAPGLMDICPPHCEEWEQALPF